VKTAKKGAGRGTGAKNYCPEEDATLVDLAQKILPIGADEWEEVAILFNTRHETGRTSDSLRKRFTKLFTTKKPTGDPDCPPVVRAAKLTRRAILAKVDSASGDEEGESQDSERSLVFPEVFPDGSGEDSGLDDPEDDVAQDRDEGEGKVDSPSQRGGSKLAKAAPPPPATP